MYLSDRSDIKWTHNLLCYNLCLVKRYSCYMEIVLHAIHCTICTSFHNTGKPNNHPQINSLDACP